MRTDQLAASITEDARKRVKEIKQETAEEVSKIEQETENILEEREKALRAEVQQKEQEEEQRQDAQRQREARMAALTRKQQLIDDTFASAAKALTAMSAKERQQLLSRLWQKTAQMDVGGIIAAKKDAAFMKKKGKVVKQTDGLGGFIATSKDGTVSMDLRFETLLHDVKERNVQEIANVLFGGKA